MKVIGLLRTDAQYHSATVANQRKLCGLLKGCNYSSLALWTEPSYHYQSRKKSYNSISPFKVSEEVALDFVSKVEVGIEIREFRIPFSQLPEQLKIMRVLLQSGSILVSFTF